MARDVQINKVVDGQDLEIFIGELSGVQAVVRARSTEIELAAEEFLQPHRVTGATEVTMQRNRARGRFARGWLVILVDHARGYEGAIEYGRKDYRRETDPMTQVKGKWTTKRIAPSPAPYVPLKRYTPLGTYYAGMKGLKILEHAVAAVAAAHGKEFRRV